MKNRNKRWDHAGIAGLFLGCAAIANFWFEWGMHGKVNLFTLGAAAIGFSFTLFGYFRLENEYKYRHHGPGPSRWERTLDVGFDRVGYCMFGPFMGAPGIAIGLNLPAPGYFSVYMSGLHFAELGLVLLLIAVEVTSRLADIGFEEARRAHA